MPTHGPYAQYKTGLEAAQAAKKSGISAIVVGGGIGGLVCATELVLNGHGPVTVYESVRKFARLGDTIGESGLPGRRESCTSPCAAVQAGVAAAGELWPGLPLTWFALVFAVAQGSCPTRG